MYIDLNISIFFYCLISIAAMSLKNYFATRIIDRPMDGRSNLQTKYLEKQKKIALLWPILVRSVLGTKALINLPREKKSKTKRKESRDQYGRTIQGESKNKP